MTHHQHADNNTTVVAGDTFVAFGKLVKVSNHGGGACRTCVFEGKGKCFQLPVCFQLTFLPVSPDEDIYLTCRLRGEI